jgi:hypothetical protein
MVTLRHLTYWAVVFIFSTSLFFSQHALADKAKMLSPICKDQLGNWLTAGASCGPKGFTCQRLGDGPALSCKRAQTR